MGRISYSGGSHKERFLWDSYWLGHRLQCTDGKHSSKETFLVCVIRIRNPSRLERLKENRLMFASQQIPAECGCFLFFFVHAVYSLNLNATRQDDSWPVEQNDCWSFISYAWSIKHDVHMTPWHSYWHELSNAWTRINCQSRSGKVVNRWYIEAPAVLF